jgi:tetratricopeptide (TPR) repeat protein
MTGGIVTYSSAACRLSLVLFSLFVCSDSAGAAQPNKPAQPVKLLLEARAVASSIQEPVERSRALDGIVLGQIAVDPAGALETLKLFRKFPNRVNHFAHLASVYAKAGRVDETERMYAEILVEDRSSREGKIAAANALGQLAIAHANTGNAEEAFRTLSRVKERSKEESLAIVGIATAGIADAQARHGDIPGAVQTALSIVGENPYPLMKIIGSLALKESAGEEVDGLVSSLDEGAQRYAQWGIVQARIQQGRLTDAQVTASAIKPGHAKASALLELATHHIQLQSKPLALVLLHEAATSARSTINEWRRADILWHIAAAMAEAGDAPAAIETAKSIEKDGHRISALHDIVRAQAKQGDIVGAFNTALQLKAAFVAGIPGSSTYEVAISDILVQLVKSGKAQEARQTVARLQDMQSEHPLLYSAISTAQADMGNIKAGKATLALVETERQRTTRKQELLDLAEKLREGQNPDDVSRWRKLQSLDVAIRQAQEAIAKAYARKGDLAGAIAAANELNLPSDRLGLIKEISALQTQTAGTESALRWARGLPSPSDKAYALLGIATALPDAKNKRTPK